MRPESEPAILAAMLTNTDRGSPRRQNTEKHHDSPFSVATGSSAPIDWGHRFSMEMIKLAMGILRELCPEGGGTSLHIASSLTAGLEHVPLQFCLLTDPLAGLTLLSSLYKPNYNEMHI